ncbi:MAG TPA: VCBS repeat-containing protein [Chthonomonadaceae bacterium]|nr:VCBS repeat-containing protein [Chthonomonadaceae bacterium]
MKDNTENPELERQSLEVQSNRELSRRDLLRWAGGGMAGLTLSRLLADSASAQTLSRLRPLPRGRALPIAGSSVTPTLQTLQLPIWGDGSSFDQPVYYQTIQAGRRLQINKTIQSADIDGDGQDELIARSPNGIIVHHFDSHTGQWTPMTNGPAWSDLNGWYDPQFYQTIQTADIDGDGQAELLGRAPDNDPKGSGLQVWKYDPKAQTWSQMPNGPGWVTAYGWGWDQPSSYQTIQCADIDGDGAAELLARASLKDPHPGMQTWKYDSKNGVWNLVTWSDPFWTASFGSWDQPQCYQTIQLADIDGDGRAELLARAPDNDPHPGMQMWKYDSTAAVWNLVTWNTPAWTDSNGWNQPQCYQTIQTADIDGDGAAELIGRDPAGIRAWKYSSAGWYILPWGPGFSDGNGWTDPSYYQTIQLADIDGDGRAELMSREKGGTQVWKYAGDNNWHELTYGPFNTSATPADNTPWDEVQYFSTIQTARVFGDTVPQDLTKNPPVYPNANNPPVTDSNGKNKAVAVLLGRGFYSLQTWRYNGSGWNQSSASFPSYTGPAFPPGQVTAYQYLSQNLRTFGQPLQTTDLRQRYATLDSSGILDYLAELPGGQNALQPPPNVASTDWTIVTRQIYAELTLVGNVLNIRDLTNAQLLTNITIDQGSNGILTTVDNNLQNSLPDVFGSGNSGIFVTLVQIITNAAWAISALAAPEVAAPLSAVTGLLAAGSIGLSLIPDSDNSTTYSSDELDQLRQDLNTGFVNAATGNFYAAQAYTQDWGLLQIQGQDIAFDTTTITATTNSYELFCYQKLTPIYWEIGGLIWPDIQLYEGDYGLGSYYQQLAASPNYYSTNGTNLYTGVNKIELWASYGSVGGWVAWPIDQTSAAFQRLFGNDGLGVSFTQFITNAGEEYGWDLPDGSIHYQPVGEGYPFDQLEYIPIPLPPQKARLQKGAHLSVTATLARDTITDEVVASVTIHNVGTRALTNIGLTQARLGSRFLSPPADWIRLVSGRSKTLLLRFPKETGASGQKAVLQIRGSYKGGTFGGSFRVTLP